MAENAEEARALERLEALHRTQGYILLASTSQLARGDLIPEIYGFDPETEHRQPWIIEGDATRAEFEAQYLHCIGRPIPCGSYGCTAHRYYRVRAAD